MFRIKSVINTFNKINIPIFRTLCNYTSDVVIIGGGAIGCSTALELSRKGYSVSIVDSNRGVGQGSTSYSSGICRMYYSILDSVKFSWEGYQTWQEWQDYLQLPTSYYSDLAKLKECGVMIFDTPNSCDFLAKTSKCLQETDIPYEYLSVDEIKKIFPNLIREIELEKRYNPMLITDDKFAMPLENEHIERVFYMKHAGYVNDPLLAVENIRDAIKYYNRNGSGISDVQFIYNTTIQRVIQRFNSVRGVELSDGSQISAPIVINCAGPHSNLVTNMVFSDKTCEVENDMNLTTRPLRREICHLSLSSKYDFEKEGCILIDFDNGIYVRPDNKHNIILGSNEPPCDTLDIIDNVNNTNTEFTEQWTSQIYRGALRMKNLGIPTATNTRGVVACYDITEDWTPIYDKSAIEGYYMAIGTSGNQFKNIGVVGQFMAKLIEKNENSYYNEKKGFNFNLKRTNNVIHSSIFSRLREPNIASSRTVLG